MAHTSREDGKMSVYNHPGTGGTRSSGPCCYGCQHMGTEYTQHPPDSYAKQHLCHTHKHGEEILTGIEYRRQAYDYYWSPYFIKHANFILFCVF